MVWRKLLTVNPKQNAWECRGKSVIKLTENCNDYLAREYMNGETPFVEVPTTAPQMKI